MGEGASGHHHGERNDSCDQSDQAAQKQGKGLGPRTVGILATLTLLILADPVQIGVGGLADGETCGDGMGLGLWGDVIHGDVGGAGPEPLPINQRTWTNSGTHRPSPGQTGDGPLAAPPVSGGGPGTLVISADAQVSGTAIEMVQP
jgi:hypothetical protein